MDNELTLEDIKKAVAIVKQNPICNNKHDLSVTGFCPHCDLIWVGKKDAENLKKIMGDRRWD